MSRRVTLVALAFVVGAPLAAQEARQQAMALSIPAYTDQQRWNRQNFLTVHATLAHLAYAKARGETAEDVGKFFAQLYGPGWGEPNSGVAVRVARGFVLNNAAMPNSEATLVSATDTSATLRYRRTYKARFGETGEVYGVTVAEFERALSVFGERVAAHLGLRYRDAIDEDWVTITFSGRGSAAISALPTGAFSITLTAEQAGNPAMAGKIDLALHPDGRFELAQEGRTRARGKYTVWIDQVTFGEEAGDWACTNSPAGTYRFTPQANGDILIGTLTESCDARRRIFARRWVKK